MYYRGREEERDQSEDEEQEHSVEPNYSGS